MFWITINCLIYYLDFVLLTKVIVFLAINAAIYLYFLANVIRTRLMLRRRFAIPNTRTVEDTLVGGIVPHLCVMQLLRHTSDYDTLAGFCFTANGVSSHVRFMLPDQMIMAASLSDFKEDGSLSTMLSIPLR